MSGYDIEKDLVASESEEDTEITEFLRKLLEEVDENDYSTHVLITLISDAGTRTFSVEAGGAKRASRTIRRRIYRIS